LKAQEEKHKADYKTISDERIRLEQQLYEARKTGNQAAIDQAVKGLTELNAKEKAYQAESQKITDAKIQAAQVVASAMIQSADTAGMAQLKVLNAQLAAQGLQAEFDSAGKVVVKAMQDATIATDGQVNATDKARKAAAALGIDLDVSLNRVSEKFAENSKNVTTFAAGLEDLGVKGKQAGNVTYEAWLTWLQTAKSQAEIDMAKAKLQEFGDQGKVSTGQVEQGLIAIKHQAQELPDDIDPVTEAFRRLGIETKENLKLAAQQALMDYITIRDSGKATAEGVQKAYEKAAQSAAASGDAGVIAATNAANAGRNLEIQIDDTGVAAIKSMDEWAKSNDRVKDSARGIGDGYRHAGQIAREEAKSSTEAWADALKATQGKMEASKTGKTAKYGLSVEEIEQRLKDIGYEGDAKQKAQELFKAAEPVAGGYYKSASNEWVKKNYGVSAYDNQKAMGNGMYVLEQIEKLSQYVGKNSSSRLNNYAPSIPSAPSVRDIDSSPKTTIRIEAGNGQYVDAQVNADQVNPLTQILKQLGTLKGST
jgi:hypothetical protein